MKNDLLLPLVGTAAMVVCCLLPVLIVGGGAAGILAWIGGLNPSLILAAVGVGGVVAYYVVRRGRKTADRRERLPGAAPPAAQPNAVRSSDDVYSNRSADDRAPR